MEMLENLLTEKREDFPGMSTVSNYMKRITTQFYMNKARTATIADVKRKIKALEN
jgi:hypothetical protein